MKWQRYHIFIDIQIIKFSTVLTSYVIDGIKYRQRWVKSLSISEQSLGFIGFAPVWQYICIQVDPISAIQWLSWTPA